MPPFLSKWVRGSFTLELTRETLWLVAVSSTGAMQEAARFSCPSLIKLFKAVDIVACSIFPEISPRLTSHDVTSKSEVRWGGKECGLRSHAVNTFWILAPHIRSVAWPSCLNSPGCSVQCSKRRVILPCQPGFVKLCEALWREEQHLQLWAWFYESAFMK